jgi:hypothetical protein
MRKFLDSQAQSVKGYLPSISKVAAGTGNFFFPNTSAAVGSGTGQPILARQVTPRDMTPLWADAALLGAGGVAGAGVNAGARAVGNAITKTAVPYLRKAAYASDSPAVRETLAGRHFGPENLSVLHPRDVPVVDARTGGPGTYFANGGGANSMRLRLPGDRSSEYSVPLSFMDRYKLANSQGYAGPDDVSKAISDLGIGDKLLPNQSIVPLNEMSIDSPLVKDLLRKGFVGFNQGKNSFPTGEFTNWLVGANDIGRINSKLPQLGLRSGQADINAIPRLESILRKFFPAE